MALERKEVEEIALLARLALAPDELEALQADLGKILEHFAVIAGVDTTDVPPMASPEAMTPSPKDMALRTDVAEPSLPASEALGAAPKREGDLFVVPAIIQGES